MAETIPDLRGIPKARAYKELQGHCEAILDGVSDPIAAMATIAALVIMPSVIFGPAFIGSLSWSAVRVGPYQDLLDVSTSNFGRGVCGTAAAEMRTVIVPDVEKYPGHITCDARSRSKSSCGSWVTG